MNTIQTKKSPLCLNVRPLNDADSFKDRGELKKCFYSRELDGKGVVYFWRGGSGF